LERRRHYNLSNFYFFISNFPVSSTQQILGLRFFDGTVAEAVEQALDRPGLVVAPSGTCFTRLTEDTRYRRAVCEADLVLPDSGFMVLLWRLLRRRRLARISGLAYLKEMLARPELRHRMATLWILPNEEAREKSAAWLAAHEFAATRDDFYIAPIYGPLVEDQILLSLIESRRPRHIIVALSGGVQEKLGFFLRENAGYRPAIHCIGAALGFVTGYQIAIPVWADRLYLGWLLRLLSNPRRFLPRALSAFALPGLVMRHRESLPPLRTH
jgi:UDP-N-acetyl-D-mannosaminuronic acid transferase (WecB/TagA/CpsF family)